MLKVSTTAEPLRERIGLLFGASVIFGMSLWLGFPYFVGTEPFDSAAYAVLLFMGGLTFGVLKPRRGWLLAAGILLGNLVRFGIYAARTASPFGWEIGAVQVVLACLWAFGGAVLSRLYQALRGSSS